MSVVHRVPLRPEDLMWLLGSLCQIHRIPWDSALALQQFPPPYSLATLLEAGPHYGFRFSAARVLAMDWCRVTFPVIAFKRSGVVNACDPQSGTSAAAADAPLLKPALLLRADAERLLYFESGLQNPTTISQRDFAEAFEPLLLLAGCETRSTVPAEDGAERFEASFGFRWFAAELLKHKRVWRDVLVASAAIQLVGLAAPLFTQVILDKVVVHHTQSTLAVVALGLGIFMLFGAGMTWLRQYLVLHTGNRVDAVLGSHVFWHLLRLPLPYFEHRPTGTLVARLAAVETVREFLSGATVCLVLDLPFLAIFLAVMFWYSAQLSLIALGVLVLIATASALLTPILRARINDQFLLGARNQALVTEYVAGIETVKALQMEPSLRARYDDYLASYLAAGFSTRQLSNTFNVVANALEQAMTLAILCAGALLIMQNPGFTIGMLVAFQMLASRVAQPMLRLAGLWQEFQQANISVKRLGDIMNVPAEPHALTPSRAPNAAGRVEIENLSFRHSPEHPYLYRAFDLAFGSGRLTVLTGPSGSGKSTLAKLLLGFYSPSEGQIRIDGHDIGHLSANELRQYFGVVPQETVLFSGTLYENLIAANPHANFDDVIHACKVAEIHETIERLPRGYNSVIGEHGVGLSGGQKQRLAIARAILKRSRILIFDEATASLDQPTAERFAQTVNRLKGEVTVLFIAHQVPRGLHVDEIVSLGSDKPTRCGSRSPLAPLAGRGRINVTSATRQPMNARPSVLSRPDPRLPTADPSDFAPALARIQAKSPAPLAGSVLKLLLAMLICLLAWATFGKLDIVAVAEGKLVPQSYLKIVQPTEQGIVKEILVREGEGVAAGQVLMRMDPVLAEADAKTLLVEHHAKRLALRRVDAQLSGASLKRHPDDPNEHFARVEAQYSANVSAHQSALAQERSVLEKASHDLAAAEEVRAKLVQVLPHYRAQEQAFEKLAKDGFAGRLMYTDKQRERIEREQDLKTQEFAIQSAHALIAQSEKKLAQISADYRRLLQTERVEVAAQLEKMRQELAKLEHRHKLLELQGSAVWSRQGPCDPHPGHCRRSGNDTDDPRTERRAASRRGLGDQSGCRLRARGTGSEVEACCLPVPEVRHGGWRGRASERRRDRSAIVERTLRRALGTRRSKRATRLPRARRSQQ